MIADSGMLLALLLERRFGQEWHRRWQLMADPEMRWLAIHLADEASKGREVNHERTALGVLAEGRAWLPEAARTTRAADAILEELRAAYLWPLSR